MSFTFRTAEENFISALPSKVADIFYSDYYNDIQDDLFNLNRIFPFSLSSAGKEYIAERGIRISPFGTQTHPHPISKIFENNSIYNILPRFIQSNSHLAVFSMKESKSEYLYFRAKDFDLDLINRFLTAQDYGRYNNKSVVNGGQCSFEKFVHNLVPRFKKKVPDLLFFHDELMHWTLDDFIFFLARIRPSNLAFTFVFPVELLVGINKSCNSLAYSFETLDGDLFFFPDGSKQHPYQHSDSNDWPFRINEFIINSNGERLSFSLDLVESHGAHHFFILRRNAPIKQKKRFFKDFDCTFLNDIEINSKSCNLSGVIRTKVLAKVFNYLTCLKKKDIESALAKLRQLTEGKLLDHELLIVHDLSELLSRFSLSSDKPNFIDWLNPFNLRDNLKLHSRFLDFILGSTNSGVKDRLRAFSTQIKPLSVVVECGAIEVTFDSHALDKSGFFAPKSFSDLIRLKNNLKTGFSKQAFKSYRNSLSPICELVVKPDFGLLTIDQPPALHGLCLKEINHLNLPCSTKPLIQDVLILKPSGIKNQVKEGEQNIDEDKSLSKPLEKGKALESVSRASFEGESSNSSKSSSDPIDLWTSLRKNGCFLTAICSTIGKNPFSVLTSLHKSECTSSIHIDTLRKFDLDLPLTIHEMTHIAKLNEWRVWIYLSDEILKINDVLTIRPISIGGREGHVFKLSNLNFFNCSSLIEKAYLSLYKEMPIFSKYKPNLLKASKLIDSFSSMLVGLLIDKKKIMDGKVIGTDIQKKIRNNSLDLSNRNVNIVPFLGFAGSGKTRSLFSELGSSFLKVPFLWISPRSKVLEGLFKQMDKDYEESKNVPFKKQFLTFEKALLVDELPELIIIDEAPLLPPGFLDLLLCKKGVSHKTSIALIGDPLQCKFHCQDAILMKGCKIDIFEILSSRVEQKIPNHYLLKSYRFGSHKILGFVPGHGEELKILRLKEPSSESEAILVASERDKRSMGGDIDPRVMTIGESQGCTFDHCSLVLTDDLNLSDLGTVITGLTRARITIEIVCNPIKIDFYLSYMRGSNNCAYIALFNSDQLHNLCKPLLNGLEIIRLTEAGADFELKLAGDPFLKSMLSMVEEVNPDEFDPKVKLVVEDVYPKTHLPLVESGPFEIECFEKIRAREYREFWVHGAGWSSQFEDNLIPKANGYNLGPAFNPQNTFPRHKADDQVTFWAAVKKRLFFSDPTTQLQKFRNARGAGKDILKVFLRKIKLDNSVDENLMEEARDDFEKKKISKSAALIANHSIRSDTDWDERNIFLFMKSQLCKKKEKMFCDAKAGQTLACFSHIVLTKFSGVCRYIEKKLNKSLPKNFYIHQKKDFREFEEWVKENDFSGICTESDYEAFDASQDHVALAFEVALMEYLFIPIEVIEDYIFIKTHLYCKLGEFAIMRFTGEFCTFLFNTLVNMAFTFLKYDVKGNTAICFAGDDMCANSRLGPNNSCTELLSLMSLKAKVDFTRNPTFCGWYLSSFGIIKCPFLMCARLYHAMYKGELMSVIDSYFLEFCFAYEKKDLLLESLSERDLDFHYLLTRFFVKQAHLLKGSARSAILQTKEHGALMFGEGFGNDLFKSGQDNLIKCFMKQELDLLNKKGKCQLSMSENSLSSRVELIKKSLLMELTSQKFTQMSGYSNLNLQISSKDSKSISLFQSAQNLESFALMLPSLIKQRLTAYASSTMNTAFCTSLPYSFRLLGYFHQLRQLKGKCSFSTLEEQDSAQRSRMVSSLTLLNPTEPTICTALITWCLSQIQGYTKVLNFGLNSLGFISRKALMPSILTLGSCIDYSTILMIRWLRILCEITGFKSCKLVINSQILRNMCLSVNLNPLKTTVFKTLVIKGLSLLVAQFLGKAKLKLVECVDITQNLFLTALSPVNLILKRIWDRSLIITLVKEPRLKLQEFLSDCSNPGWKEMAARQILNEQIRTELRDYLWMNVVDNANEHHLTPAPGTNLTQEQLQRKNLILDHFLRNLFGNIGVEGASDKVSFLNMDLTLPAIPAAQIGAQANLVITHNLSESVGAIKAWRDNHASNTIRNLTFRSCCRPFANQCMDFLLANPDVRTNLYFTQPHNYGRAPEIAFDFADGISTNRLANNKDRQFVMSALASRTFNHEAKKGVFEAQGAVNFTFDG